MGVNVDDPDQRDFGKIVPLAQHLGADHDPIITTPGFLKASLQFPTSADMVPVQTQDRAVREFGAQPIFDPLRSFSQKDCSLLDFLFARLAESAVVANQLLACLVIRQANLAVGANHRLTV